MKIGSSGSPVIWYGDIGSSAAQKLALGGTSIWAVGARNNSWPGSGGANANLWQVDASGGTVLGSDLGSGYIWGVAPLADGTVWAGGDNSSNWPGSDGRAASLWKVDAAGDIQQAWSNGGGKIRTLATDGTYVYAVGQRVYRWERYVM